MSFAKTAALIGLAVLLSGPSWSATAQVPVPAGPFLAVEINAERTFYPLGLAEGTVGPGNVILPKDAFIQLQVIDNTADSTVPTVGQNDFLYHTITFSARFLNATGPDPTRFGATWQLTPPLGLRNVQSTQVKQASFLVQHDPSETVKEAFVELTANLTLDSDPSQYALATEIFQMRIFPSPALQLFVSKPPTEPVPPNKWVTIPFEVQNVDLYPAHVQIRLVIEAAPGVDPFDIPVIVPSTTILEPLEIRKFNVTFRTPKDQTYYSSTGLQYSIQAFNPQNPDGRQVYTGVAIIQGWYIARQIWIIIPILIALVVLLILLATRAKRYFDERVLGKPVRPWTIPEERAQLDDLRKTDPREFYLRRYFFMEQEYQSALNWFHTFKRRSKKQLTKQAAAGRYEERAGLLAEPSLAQFDRRADRLVNRYRSRQERRRLHLEAKLEGLQAKVDQHFQEDFDKDHAKWEERVEKIKKKANKPWFRAHRKWEAEVEKITEAWEKPFQKEKDKADKARAKILDKYAAQVKKKDKPTWKDWREAVENAEHENKIRAKEGREPIAMPELLSKEVERPELPLPFKAPPKPKLPPEPQEPSNLELPPEPQLVKPKLEESHYARKARRARKKTERKVNKLEHKLERALAKNERDRVRALAKADRKRSKLIHKREEVFEPSMTERVLRQTPEHREYRARRKLKKALAKERIQLVEDSEKTRLELLSVDAKRREAELLAKLIRDRATVRATGATSGMRIEPAKDPDLLELRQRNQESLQKERLAAEAKIKAEQARIDKELQAELTEELIKERARSRPAPAPEAASAKPKKA